MSSSTATACRICEDAIANAENFSLPGRKFYGYSVARARSPFSSSVWMVDGRLEQLRSTPSTRANPTLCSMPIVQRSRTFTSYQHDACQENGHMPVARRYGTWMYRQLGMYQRPRQQA
jgi:hypothetical protein